MRPLALLCLAAGFALAAQLAVAPADADEIGDLFNVFDTDHDGGITLAEFAEHRAERFAKYDANQDRQISLAEFTAGLAGDKLENRKQRFAEMDTNKDGLLTETDMAARAQDQFNEMDKSGDAKVDLAEFTAAVHPVQN